MNPTAEMILTDFGTKLPLNRRRRDALAAVAKAMAGDARSKQLFIERLWDLKDYEAKDLLKGNSSEAVWERIAIHPNGGWPVILPVFGAMLGQPIQAFFHQQSERLAHEAEQSRRASDEAASLGVAAARAIGLEARDIWSSLAGRHAGRSGDGRSFQPVADASALDGAKAGDTPQVGRGARR